MNPMNASTIPRMPTGVPLSVPSIPPIALSTANRSAEIHPQMTSPMTIFPRNPPSVTSFGALSRSFTSGFFTIGSGLVAPDSPQSGGILLGSKVVASVIWKCERDKEVL